MIEREAVLSAAEAAVANVWPETGGLTERHQRALALLVTTGMSHKEIAHALATTESAIKHFVGRLCIELGISPTSRSALAAAVVRRALRCDEPAPCGTGPA